VIKFWIAHGRNLYDFIYAGNAAEGHLLAAHVCLFLSFFLNVSRYPLMSRRIPMELVSVFIAI
jgi:hypothetical protein